MLYFSSPDDMGPTEPQESLSSLRAGFKKLVPTPSSSSISSSLSVARALSMTTTEGMPSDHGDLAVPNRTTPAAVIDAPLHLIGFELDVVSADQVTGRLKITEKCCQPFKVLHGGVSALIAEALGSIGAHVASGFRRVAGIQLSINHYRSAGIGELVFARAAPLHVGKTVQVWEVCMWKMDPSTSEKGAMVASSRVTVLSTLPSSETARIAGDNLRKYAKL